MKLKETYNSIVSEAILGEARAEFSSLPDSFAAVINKGDTSLITLIDTSKLNEDTVSEEQILPAIIGMVRLQDTNTPHEMSVFSSAAVKGYGLIMYELAMQMIYPKKVVSARDWNITDSAIRMYDYFYKGLNSAVEVTKLSPEDPDYVPCDSKQAYYLKCDSTTPYMHQLYNSKLAMKPNELPALLSKAKNIPFEVKDSEITRASLEFFEIKYD